MRVGDNPVRDTMLESFGRHRIIIPIYVPTLDGYYADAPNVLELCLESLRLTTAGRVAVTLISNAAVPVVAEMLQKAFDDGWVDELVLYGENHGKVDAISAAARGCFEELVSVTDCDVLFRPGWPDAVEDIFRAFPECGVVSPSPNPATAAHFTSATLIGAMLRGETSREGVVPRRDLERFAHSIERPDLYSARRLERQLIVRRNGVTACVGAGHFAFTMRREIVRRIPERPSRAAQGARSEDEWFDAPPDTMGAWRLATSRAYVYHMGNAAESWMYDEVARCKKWAEEQPEAVQRTDAPLPPLRPHWTARVPIRARRRLLGLIKRTGYIP